MTYAFVQAVPANADAATITSSVAGNLLILVIENSGGGERVISVTSGFTIAGTELVDAGNNATNIYYYQGNPGGITSVGVTAWGGGTPGSRRMRVFEYSGIATTSALIVAVNQSQSSPGTGANAVTSGNGNVTSQPALIFGFGGAPGTGDPFNAGTGYTSRLQDDGSRFEDKRVTATGNVAATFTDTGGASATQAWMVAFAEAGGGSPAVITSPTATNITSVQATVGFTTDTTSGTEYSVVDTAANMAGVTTAQLKLGQNKNGSQGVSYGFTGIGSTSASDIRRFLTPATLYTVSMMQTSAGGDSNIVSTTFTTPVTEPLLFQRRTTFVDESVIQI